MLHKKKSHRKVQKCAQSHAAQNFSNKEPFFRAYLFTNALPRYNAHLNPVTLLLSHESQQKSYEPFRVCASPSCCTPVFSHQSLKDNEEAYSAFLGVRWTVGATAASSCGRCASLCAWWLGQWS